MILRALFWIAVVAVFMPREPDLGFGRPGAALASIPVPSANLSLSQAAAPIAGALNGTNAVRGVVPIQACADHAQTCSQVLAAVDQIQGFLVSSMSNVKAQLEAQKRETAGS